MQIDAIIKERVGILGCGCKSTHREFSVKSLVFVPTLKAELFIDLNIDSPHSLVGYLKDSMEEKTPFELSIPELYIEEPRMRIESVQTSVGYEGILQSVFIVLKKTRPPLMSRKS